MDLLIVEPLEHEVAQWLEARHSVRFAPELARDPRGFRQALYNVRAMIIPPSVTLDAAALHYAPVLRAVGLLNLEQTGILARYVEPEICNTRGEHVGEIRARAKFVR